VSGGIIGRRTALRAIAVAAGLPLLGASGDRGRPPVLRWRGLAFGGPAALTLCHPDAARARRVLALCLAEVDRLDRLFSLLRKDSALVALNREGRLEAPAHDVVALMAAARRFAELSDGAFDPTVQPLWRLYARHFSRPGADPAGPPAAAVAAARAQVGYQRIEIGRAAVRLARPGMAVTLNGIAQGWITDRIAAILRDAGFARALVEMGEIRALGGGPTGAWRIGAAGTEIALRDGAVATSAPRGTVLEPSGRFHHLLDPASGRPTRGVREVSAVAATASTADALATALAVAPDRAPALVARFKARQAILVRDDGTVRRV